MNEEIANFIKESPHRKNVESWRQAIARYEGELSLQFLRVIAYQEKTAGILAGKVREVEGAINYWRILLVYLSMEQVNFSNIAADSIGNVLNIFHTMYEQWIDDRERIAILMVLTFFTRPRHGRMRRAAALLLLGLILKNTNFQKINSQLAQKKRVVLGYDTRKSRLFALSVRLAENGKNLRILNTVLLDELIRSVFAAYTVTDLSLLDIAPSIEVPLSAVLEILQKETDPVQYSAAVFFFRNGGNPADMRVD